MRTIVPKKRWEFSLRIIFLFVVFLVLLISTFVYKSTHENIENIGRDSQVYAQIFYFTIPKLLGWVFFLTAIVFFLFDRTKKRISAFPITFGLTAIIVSTSYFSIFPSDIIHSIWSVSVLSISITFFFHFIHESIIDNSIPKIKIVILILSGFLVIGIFVLSLPYARPLSTGLERVMILWSGILMGLALILGFTHFLRNRNMFDDGVDKFSAVGFILSWFPFCILLFQIAIYPSSAITPWIFLPFAFHPIFLGWLIKQEENMTKKSPEGLDLRGVRGMLVLYSLIGLIILGANLINQSTNQYFLKPPLYVGLILFLLPFVFLLMVKQKEFETQPKTFPDRDGIIDILIGEGKNNFDQWGEIGDIHEELKMKISDHLEFELYHHFVLDHATNEYHAIAFNAEKTSDLHFTSDSNLIQYLIKIKTPIMLSDFNHLPPELVDERDKLELLNTNVLIPIIFEDHLNGWLSFSFENHQPGAVENLISKLKPSIDHYSNAINNAYQHKNLEQRLSDLDVLTRIVQGVNYTLALDDIYELIYAQTTQVIPADDFFIVLKDHQTKILRYVFIVELDARFSEKENKPITQKKTIEAQVIESGVSLNINNFSDYCLTRNFPVFYSEIEAAMIVPLNTGAITNGCIILGKRDQEKRFSETQLTLVQSIADLVAGAIEKARLLEETEQYARQLAILNDLTRKLTSTLEIEEVYSTILQNSVAMVNCEEARLIIANEKNQKFVFEAVIGKKSNDLFQSKVTLDFGLIGKAYLSKNQLMINRINADQDVLDEMYTFYERQVNSLLIIPMISKNQVLGLIELVNRLDGTGFTKNDQDLLSALSDQAAIALENARLYRRTDQELAKRVEELSVMQRIDRELNISLDMKKAMELTLTWAIRQSGCEAGWIGLISDSKLSGMASSGYDKNQQNQIEQKTAFLDFWGAGKVNKRFDSVQIDVNQATQVHPMATSQILLPIRREEKIIALMILENFANRKLDENELNFLFRLCEHASIAIVNSQLYAQVQEANQAKSEFVSLVAHELKKPDDID